MNNYLHSGVAAILGVASLFLSGFPGMMVALAAILLATLVARTIPNLVSFIILPPALAMLFFCLQTFGLFPSQASREIDTVYASIETTNQAFALLAQEKSASRRDDLIRSLDEGVVLANSVDVQTIDNLVPGFSASFQENYITGSRTLSKGFKEDDIGLKLKGGVLMDTWAQWNLENKETLEQARRKQPSPAEDSSPFALHQNTPPLTRIPPHPVDTSKVMRTSL